MVMIPAETLFMLEQEAKDRAAARSCSCHTADQPPIPCAERYASSECKRVEGLRTLVDIIWRHATEGASYPSTKTADMLIARYIDRVGAVEAFHKSSDPQ